MRIKNSVLFFIVLWVFPQLTLSINNSQLIRDSIKQENWQNKYKGRDAKGSHIVAFWDFDNKRNLGLDVSGNGNDVYNINKSISREGKFGSGLNTDIAPLIVKKNLSLNLSSDFSIEMWINPLRKQSDKVEIDLLNSINDKLNSINNIFSGYKLSLISDSIDSYYLYAELGFETRYVHIKSNKFTLGNKNWGHVAFTYDGNGNLKFYFNGHKIGEYYEEGVNGISPNNFDLLIGKQNKENIDNDLYLLIDEVRISNRVLEYSPYKVEISSDRQTFVRMEENASVKLKLTNISNVPVNNITFNIGWGWGGLGRRFKHSDIVKQISTINLAKNEYYEVAIPVNTKLRSDKYYITVDYTDNISGEKYLLDYFPITIVNRKLPDEYPVIMWGPSWGSFGALDKIKKIGFTHAFGLDVDYRKIWEAEKPVLPGDEKFVRETRRNLDKALAKGISIIPQLRPALLLDTVERFKRVDRNGQFYNRSHLNVLYPEIQKYTYEVGVSLADAYGDLPAFGGALLHSETRDISYPSFKEIDSINYKKNSGRDLPKSVAFKRGNHFRNIIGFPKDRVISDSDSLYTYFKWYWKEGDGWNNVNDELHKGFKDQLSKSRPDFWTFQDPAVRTGSVYGSGGLADVISHWTYTYPNPLKIGLTTDELLCMADGAGQPQDVMSMTQIIWYRSQTAPTKEDKRNFEPKTTAQWEKTLPPTGIQYISISPSHLSEAFWAMISRPITGIMYHGWQSLVPDNYHSVYFNTNDAISLKLNELIKDIIQPLGPVLKSIPGIKSDIAFYQSFASQVYAGRGTMGWAGTWLGDSYLMFNYAGLQPNIVYDETLNRDKLNNIKVLVMMDCDVITESVKNVIQDFQNRGGIIIADKELTPSIKADIVLDRFVRTGHAYNDKILLMNLAEELLVSLENFNYKSYISTSNMNLITYLRRFNSTDYVFLMNDNREYGDYVGQHGLVMENGKPTKSKLFINRANGFAYDLVNHRHLDNFIIEKNSMNTNVELGAGAGSLIMITEKKIDEIKLFGPETLSPGQSATFSINVNDASGKQIDAIIPIEFEIKDSEGRILEKSGYWKALSGVLEIDVDIAENDVKGVYQVKAKELASGKTVYLYPRLGSEIKIEPTFKDEEKSDSFQPRG